MTEQRITLDGTVHLSEESAGRRAARLLVCGDYPKKGLTVTRDDLDALVAHFSGPVPVKVEHIDSPLDPFGEVEDIWREGDALMGRLAFPPPVAALLAERGARGLSVGLLPAPRWRLLEASLTSRPHVPEAALLSEGAAGRHRAPDRHHGPDPDAARLRDDLRAARVDARIADLKRAGRLVPAAEAPARALLAMDAPGVTLSDPDGGEAETAAALFLRVLAAQPPAVRLGEAAPSGPAPEPEGPEFDAEARALFRQLDVDPAAVARTMAGENQNIGSRTKKGR